MINIPSLECSVGSTKDRDFFAVFLCSMLSGPVINKYDN